MGKHKMGRDKNNLPLKEKIFIIFFEANTMAGRAFDIILLWTILTSILIIFILSLPNLPNEYFKYLYGLEWIITVLFTIEYIVRVWIVRNKFKYMTSFFGIIDLLAILPTYLSLYITGGQFVLILRTFRLLRVFRILNLGKYISESYSLLNAMKASRYKITVFLEAVLVIVVIVGTLMYLIEGETSGFDSIPVSVYWAIVTLTTVGFGDITPVTPLGRVIASFLMLLGYAIIAVPTGIVSTEMARIRLAKPDGRTCTNCRLIIEDKEANYCKNCGVKLEKKKE